MAGMIIPRDEKVLQTLLTLDALRGIDSTGIAVIPRVGEVKIAKQVGNPYNLFDHKTYDKALLGVHRAIIGHNRWATQGGVNRANAHPFDFDTVVGCHNGTLKNKHVLLDHKDFVVDSENIYHHIDKRGVKNTIPLLEGAWALVWWDKIEESINFIRNKERPLYLVFNKLRTVVYWASEKWMLNVALSREGVEIEEPFELPIDKHWSMHLPSNPQVTKFKEVDLEGMPAWIQGIPYTYTAPFKKVEPRKVDTLKNSRVVPITTLKKKTLLSSDSYVGSKNIQIEVYTSGMDQHGAFYYDCFDLADESRELRLYYSPKDPELSKLAKRGLITGDIGNLYETADGDVFYKIVPSSVVVIVNSEEELMLPANSSETYYETATRQLVTEHEWMVYHGVCDNCGGNVSPREKFQFLRNGGTICAFCADDEEFVKTVTVLN